MNLSRLLKALLPSLVPLLVFIAADALFGEIVGLAVGLAVGVIEFVFVLVRDRRADPFIAIDTLLLAAAVGLSLALKNDLFFKLKPAVIEVVFGGAFAALLVLPPSFLEGYMKRQLRGIEFPSTALPAMKRSLGLMLAILGIHAALTVFAALALSTAAWGFVSGGLLYILFGLVFLVEYLAGRRQKRSLGAAVGAAPGEELLPLVDEEGRVVGVAPRSACHQGPGKLHPVVRLQAVDGSGRIYLRRKAGEGKWDSAFSCHVVAGETLEAALSRGLRTELGLGAMALEAAGSAPRPVFRYRLDGENGSELVFSFLLRHEGPFPPPGAGLEARFWTGEEIRASFGSETFAPDFEREFKLYEEAFRRAAAQGDSAPTGSSPDIPR